MKPTLLFIHGFRGNQLGLREVADNFPKKSYDVYLLDLPPTNGTTLKEYSPRLYARFVANFIKEHELEKPILIGHSMGSIVTAAVAERYPELISDKIVFLSPISVRPNKLFSLASPFSATLPNKVVSRVSTKYLFVPKNDKELLKKTLATTNACGRAYHNKRALYASARFAANYSINDFTFEKQALFLSGDKERLVPREKTEKVAEKFNGKTVYIKNTGHLLNYEDPKSVAKEIKKFIKPTMKSAVNSTTAKKSTTKKASTKKPTTKN